MYQALYRKYRPKTLEEVCGQPTIVKIINNSITNNKTSHAYLFSGPRGTGKTSIAKIFAKMVNCENLNNNTPCDKCVSCTQTNNSDIIEIDAASNNGVDEIRELRNKVNLVPSYGKYKVYIIDEVHMLTTAAFNALLKTLEEPPAHIIFILATTDPHKIPETILSRCQRFDFKKISDKYIVERLKIIVKKEKINIEDNALIEIARLSDGGMRDSIGMLDQAISYTDEKITVNDIHEINGTITSQDLKELIELITNNDLENIFKKLDIYNDIGKNFVKLTEELIAFMRNILLCLKAPKYFADTYGDSDVYKDISCETNIILKYIDLLNDGLIEMKKTNNTKLLLELSIIKMLNTEEIKDVKVMPKLEVIKEEKPLEEVKKPKIKPSVPNETLIELKEIRIENTLAKFNKKIIKSLGEKINELNNYLLDPDISQYAGVILDGTLKAASEENLIFVYDTERSANAFNESLLNIEDTLEKVLSGKYKAIATDKNHWDKIKNEFNGKKKEYTYKEEHIDIEKLLKPENKTEFSGFEDIIVYN